MCYNLIAPLYNPKLQRTTSSSDRFPSDWPHAQSKYKREFFDRRRYPPHRSWLPTDRGSSAHTFTSLELSKIKFWRRSCAPTIANCFFTLWCYTALFCLEPFMDEIGSRMTEWNAPKMCRSVHRSCFFLSPLEPQVGFPPVHRTRKVHGHLLTGGMRVHWP